MQIGRRLSAIGMLLRRPANSNVVGESSVPGKSGVRGESLEPQRSMASKPCRVLRMWPSSLVKAERRSLERPVARVVVSRATAARASENPGSCTMPCTRFGKSVFEPGLRWHVLGQVRWRRARPAANASGRIAISSGRRQRALGIVTLSQGFGAPLQIGTQWWSSRPRRDGRNRS
jgi:hypothetical protein